MKMETISQKEFYILQEKLRLAEMQIEIKNKVIKDLLTQIQEIDMNYLKNKVQGKSKNSLPTPLELLDGVEPE
jgi:hypothetical protein